MKEKEPEKKMIVRTILRMGYRRDRGDSFSKNSISGKTIIRLLDSGVHIKVYTSGYGESDFLLKEDITKSSLKKFIRNNEL